MLQFIQFLYDIVQNRAIGLFICKHTSDCFQRAELYPNPTVVELFSQYLKQCETDLKRRKEEYDLGTETKHKQELAMIEQSRLGWNYLRLRLLDILQSGSVSYLEKCTYYVMDPHIGKDGVRHKMMKMIPPFAPYITSEDSQSQMEAETDLHASTHLVSLLMSQRKPSAQ